MRAPMLVRRFRMPPRHLPTSSPRPTPSPAIRIRLNNMAYTLSRYSIIFIAGALALFIISFAFVASAQESTITFPVSELGNCKDKKACHAYCDDLAHVTECVAFAESHGLMSTDEARQARKFSRLGGKGPGGCTSKDSCESY